jgi:hypothetical protein
MLDEFEFFEDNQTSNNENRNNQNTQHNNIIPTNTTNTTNTVLNNNVDINSIFNNNIFETAPQQTNTVNNNLLNNGINNNNFNNSNNNVPSNNTQPKKTDLNIDQLYGQYNQPNIGYPSYPQSQFNQMNPIFNSQMNPQMNTQMGPQMNGQMNPQMMNMIMSNPQLVYQLMQQLKQQQQIPGGFQVNSGLNPGVFTSGPQVATNFPSVINPQGEGKSAEEEKKDYFKDIYSYSENKKKHVYKTIK